MTNKIKKNNTVIEKLFFNYLIALNPSNSEKYLIPNYAKSFATYELEKWLNY
jgi:hypothetical protein